MRVPSTTPAAEVAAALREQGAVLIEDLLPSDTLARFNAEIEPHLEAAPLERDYVNPLLSVFFQGVRQVGAVAGKSRTFATEILCHPLLLACCDEVLLPNCSRYQLNVASVLARGPGSPQQLIHRDEDVWVHLPRPHPEVQVATIFALEDFTAENGATRIVPGSHRWERERQPQDDEIAIAEMSAGSAVMYLGSVLHGGGPNETASMWRRGMHHSYVVGWLRTEENNYLGTPLEVARTYPRKAQELIGYAAHDAILSGGGYLGVLDGHDPVDLIEKAEL